MQNSGWRKALTTGLFVAWALAWGWSLIGSFWLVEPSGGGWDRGLNRLSSFMYWQFIAGILALPLAVFAKSFAATRSGRWLLRLPLILAFLLVLCVALIILAAQFGLYPGAGNVPADPPGPPTAPAAPAQQVPTE